MAAFGAFTAFGTSPVGGVHAGPSVVAMPPTGVRPVASSFVEGHVIRSSSQWAASWRNVRMRLGHYAPDAAKRIVPAKLVAGTGRPP